MTVAGGILGDAALMRTAFLTRWLAPSEITRSTRGATEHAEHQGEGNQICQGLETHPK